MLLTDLFDEMNLAELISSPEYFESLIHINCLKIKFGTSCYTMKIQIRTSYEIIAREILA